MNKKEIVPVKLKTNTDRSSILESLINDALSKDSKVGPLGSDTMLRDWYKEKNIVDTTYEEVHDNPFPIKELKARLKELAPVDIEYEEVKPEQLSDGRENKKS